MDFIERANTLVETNKNYRKTETEGVMCYGDGTDDAFRDARDRGARGDVP